MKHFLIKPQEVHVWVACMEDFFSEKTTSLLLLSQDEIKRAERFQFAIHRERFIASRALLRRLVSLYAEIPADKIMFSYGEHRKPFVENSFLHFNLSHSDNRVVYVFAIDSEVGIDIEKIKPQWNEDIAKRFFHETEYAVLKTHISTEQVDYFYQLWARKEACLKAIGYGLFTPLQTFSVVDDKVKIAEKNIYLKNIAVATGYQSAIAAFFPMMKISYWRWGVEGPSLLE